MAGDNDEPDDSDFAQELPPDGEAPPKREGPPEDWDGPSWFDFVNREWWYDFGKGSGWRRDPPPVRPLGHADGEYSFITRVGEKRTWTSSQLHGRGGMADLFGGDLRWPMRHYPGVDNKGNPTGQPSVAACMKRLIWVCQETAYLDGTMQHRSVGTWRGPDGTPVVHAGDCVFYDGEMLPPGTLLGDTLYVIGGKRKQPAHAVIMARRGEPARFDWQPATSADGLWLMNALDSWHWLDEETRQLFGGGLFLDTLGDAPVWKNHMFVQAPPESGKSTLLHFAAAVLGGSAGPLLKTFSKAYIEGRYSGMGLTVLLDESESDLEVDRIRHLFELLRSLNDDGAVGGRGSATGKTREFNVHGPVIMAATVRERWRPQDRRRVQLLELRPFRDRDTPQDSKAAVLRLTKEAGERSAALRARALEKWPLYLRNFAAAHKAVMDLGGTSGDGDQLGGFIAGWWTLVYDDEADEERIDDVKRFKDFIRTVTEAEAGDDEASECFNYLLGAPVHGVWRGGEILTVGQTIARARDADHAERVGARDALHAKGMRLVPMPGEPWDKAWLAIANDHNGLDDIFAKKPQWADGKWNQVMRELPGSQSKHPADPANPALRFAGPQRRCLFVPPIYLPLVDDERP